MAENKSPFKVMIDCDTGVDDALALLLCLNRADVQVLCVTCVAGNGDVDTTLAATLKVLDSANAPADLPVARGFETPLIEKIHYAPFIHGTDCLGDLKPPIPDSARKVCEEHATQLMLKTLKELPEGERCNVIALAPLTNVAVSMRLAPKLWREKVERVYWMGGAVSRGGNFNIWSEANAVYDPEAAHIVLNSGIPMTMYPWDSFMDVDFTREELARMGFQDRHGQTAGWTNSGPELATRLFFREMRQWNKDTAVLGDAGAVICMLDPGAVEAVPSNVRMELTGTHTRGMTAVDLRHYVDPPDLPKGPNNVDVVMKVDVARMKRVFARAVFGDEKAALL